MKRKLLFVIALFIFMYTNTHAASCVYTYTDPDSAGKITFTVDEDPSKTAIVNNAENKYYVDANQINKIDKNVVRANGSSCIPLYYIIQWQEADEKYDFYIQVDKPADMYYEPAFDGKVGQLEGIFSNEPTSASCQFKYKVQNVDIVYNITPGNYGYVNVETYDQFTDIEVNYQNVRNLTPYFYPNGTFSCDSGEFGMVSCEKNNKMYVYFGSQDYLKGLCQKSDGYTNQITDNFNIEEPKEEKVYPESDIHNFCEEESIQKTLKFIGTLYLIAKIIIPILLIVLGTIDYFKAVVASNQDEIQKSTKSLITRCIIGLIIFFIPTIVNFAFELFPNNANVMKYNKCRTCIFKPSKCGKFNISSQN